MARRACPREAEILDAIGAGRWEECRDEELGSHVANCETCSEIALVASALLEDRGEAVRDAAVPPSGQVWWRMQMRARREEQLAAGRTVSAAQAVVLVCASSVALATLGAGVLPGWGAWIARSASALPARLLELSSLPVSGIWIAALAGAAILLLAPVAVWFAITEE